MPATLSLVIQPPMWPRSWNIHDRASCSGSSAISLIVRNLLSPGFVPIHTDFSEYSGQAKSLSGQICGWLSGVFGITPYSCHQVTHT